MDYSVIIPIYNEEDSAVLVYNSVNEVMSKLGGTYEIIFVDDGSTDSSAQRLGHILNASGSLVIVSLAERVGQSEALQAGFDNAQGDIYVTLDGDGQYEPREIPRLLDKLAEGYDVVCGWRFQRQDPLLKKIASWVACIVRKLTMREKIHDVGCTLRAFRKEVLEKVCLWGGLHRFFSAIMCKRGYRIAEVQVHHYPRKSGVSKYGIAGRLKRGLVDLCRISFVDLDKLMDHEREYKVKQILRV
jgi:glycosyltransferase involved in cell wall biosynthesis